MSSPQTAVHVPSLLTSPADVARLRREVAALDSYLDQQALRAPGEPPRLPKTSRILEELAAANQLNLLDKHTRERVAAFLADVEAHAPIVHISFASDPSSAFMQKIVMWFRQNIHPAMLVRVGLQPTIAAGCVLRTTNKYFDLSLRQTLKKHQPELLAAVKSRGAKA